MNKAIIGGTGVYTVYDVKEVMEVKTEYGAVEITVLDIDGEEVAFLPRHGKEHNQPPHKISYKANMIALNKCGVKYIYALATSGSLDEDVVEGSIVVMDDFIDFSNRNITYYDGNDGRVVHTDMSDPYCSNLRDKFNEVAIEHEISVVNGGTYISVNGPRFETKAEIKMYQSLGGRLVGMTNVPEVTLAKELGMCYSAIGLISNMACGIKNEVLTDIDHGKVIEKAKENTIKIVIDVFKSIELSQNNCGCSNATLDLSK